jgi:transposase
MPTVAEVVDAVVGGDTHADSHTLQIALPSSVPVATETFANTAAGLAAAVAWIVEHAPGPRVVVGLEGTRSYGIALERVMTAAGFPVVEVERPARTDRRGRGKSDPIDARHAVLRVLALDTDKLPTPRNDGDREALRILLAARRDLTTSKTAWSNQLTALLRGGQDNDRDLLASGGWTQAALTRILRRRHTTGQSREQVIRREETQRLARAILTATAELKTNRAQLLGIVEDLTPGITERVGIGPVSAAQALVSFSHPGRIHSEAAFAALAGASPLPASSGKTVRHRLNRGGDRALNRALHDIAKTRMRCDPRTHAYIARRRAEGKTDREIRRCLKRYIARELYRTLDNT